MAPIPSAWQCPLLTPAQCRSFLSQTNSRDKNSISMLVHFGSHCATGVCTSGMSLRIWVQMGACPHLSRMTSRHLAPDKHTQGSRAFARWHQRSHMGCASCPLNLGMQLDWHGESCPLLTQGVLCGFLASFS